MRIALRLSITLTVLTAACHTTAAPVAPIGLEPLEVVESIEVSYDSIIAPVSALPLDAAEPDVQIDATGALIQVDVQVIELRPEHATELLGAPAGLGGWRVDGSMTSTAITELCDAGKAELFHEARLGVYAGQPGWIMIQNQEAYVAAYDVRRAPSSLLADPAVGVLTEGFQLRAVAERDSAGAILLDLRLTLVELERPILSTQAAIPGSHVPVTIQLPVASRQELTAAIRLEEQDGAVLSGLALNGRDTCLLVLLTART